MICCASVQIGTNVSKTPRGSAATSAFIALLASVRDPFIYAQHKGHTDVVLVSYGGLEVDSIKQREDAFRDECKARALRHRVERGSYQGNIRGVLRDHVKMSFAQRQPVEEMMVRHMVRQMKENDAPAEQFERLGLPVVHGVD